MKRNFNFARLAINVGICDIIAILYYLNLDAYIDNLSAIDLSILVQNFTFKVKYRQNQREIPSLLTINFGKVRYLPF